MKTTYPSSQSPQEPEQTPPELKLNRVVRRNAALGEQAPVVNHQSPSVEVPEVPPTAPLVTPISPIPAEDGKLRLSAFASNNVDFLPTVALPAANNDLSTLPAQQSPAPSISGSGYNELENNYPQNQPPTGNTNQFNDQQQQLEKPSLVPNTVHRVGHTPEIGEGHIVLHRTRNFYVRTTNRRGQRPNPLRRRTGHTTLLPTVAPDQEQRTIASSTRLLPKVAPINPFPVRGIRIPLWLEAFVVMVGLLVGLAAHAYNLFYYPQYGLDEGTYMSSAWAILHGSLEPYAYGYGHPPLAWIQIAAWVQMTGGLFTFGDAINSGRVLMLLFAMGSSLFLYLIVRRLLGSRSGALLAMVLFSLSPLCITYQRQVLLDNVATFWLLVSLYFLVIGNSRLLFIVLSAVAFGICLLSKEVLLLYFPVIIYAVWLHTTRFQRKFALVAFIYTVTAIGSLFILMAVLKGELLPTGWLPWDHHQHLSLLSTYIGQVQRGQSQGSIQTSINAWSSEDYFFLVASIATTFFNLILGWWNRKYLLLALFAFSYWILFMRNGVTFAFYIIPLLPFCAINIATVMNTLSGWLSKLLRFHLLQACLILLFIGGIVVYDAQHSQMIFTQNLTSPQTRAIAWIRNNIPHNAFVVINSYLFADLHEPGGAGVGNGAIYPYAHIYWNVAFDPEIHDNLLKGDWNHIDYIVTDTPMLYDIQTLGGDMSFVNVALQHSSLLADFRVNKYDVQNSIRIYKVNHSTPSPQLYQNPSSGNGTTDAVVSVSHATLTPQRLLSHLDYLQDIYNNRKTNIPW